MSRANFLPDTIAVWWWNWASLQINRLGGLANPNETKSISSNYIIIKNGTSTRPSKLLGEIPGWINTSYCNQAHGSYMLNNATTAMYASVVGNPLKLHDSDILACMSSQKGILLPCEPPMDSLDHIAFYFMKYLLRKEAWFISLQC